MVADAGCVISTCALDAWCEAAAPGRIAPQGLLLHFALGASIHSV